MNRRDLLKALGSTSIAGTGCLHGLSFSAQPTSPLVVVFLRGGADSLHLVAPVDDPNYVAARPPELRVLGTGSSPGLALPRPLSPGQDWRIHPSASPLHELMQSGHAQLLHACALANATRSHFVAQEVLEASVPSGTGRVLSDTPGWLQPHLAAQAAGPGQSINFVGTSPALIRSLQGLEGGMNLAGELRDNVSLPGEATGRAVLSALYKADPNRAGPGTQSVDRVGRQALEQIALLDTRLVRVEGRVPAYAPPRGVQYNTEDGEWLRACQAVAQLVRMDVGLRVACMDLGGWDTHESQGYRVNYLARRLSANLRALFDDVKSAGKDMTLVVVSEFGRRLRSNASGGTDHGHAGAVWLLDTRARTLLPPTRWPGLATQSLDQGLDLQHTQDIKQVLNAVAQQVLGT